jgi:hypothetical protein
MRMTRTAIFPTIVRVSVAVIATVCGGCAVMFPVQTPAIAGKRVEIDKTTQTLRAFESGTLVFQSRVSTGRMGRCTPTGNFAAGIKLRMHHSTLYDNAPMPWSVQVKGNYFIHGFKSVPYRPASHGCIRLPLDGENPAKWFFDWVEPGTPIVISGEWAGKPKEARAATVAAPAGAARRESREEKRN